MNEPRSRNRRYFWLVAISVALLTSSCAASKAPPEGIEQLARFEPSPPEVVEAMLSVASITSKDVVYDLGSGDGRIVIAAAKKFGARGVGIEMDPKLVGLARENARKAGVEERVSFREEDVLSADFSDATVVMLFLSRTGNAKLENRLKSSLAPGVRVVSHCHRMSEWEPDKELRTLAAGREHRVYLWTVRGSLPPNLGPFVPTPMPIVERMLALAQVTRDDVVYDLGCGDGRIVIEAAKRYGARGVGIEYDLRRVEEARARAEREGVAGRVEIRHQDIFQSDFSDATVIALYLLPQSNELLASRLHALKPGTRIVAHDFGIGNWQPLKREVLWLHDTDKHTVLLWRVGEGSEE